MTYKAMAEIKKLFNNIFKMYLNKKLLQFLNDQ